MDILPLLGILLQILLIDLVLAGDNAIVIGLAVNGLQAEQRRRAILVGIAGATVIRVLFALIALQMLAVIGLTLAGGVLLLWVVWKSIRELQGQGEHAGAVPPVKSLSTAIWRIIVADVSMSLDNVLAVAGAARAHPVLLAVGLIFSVGLMGVAASFVARMLSRFPWLAWVGIGIVLYVALVMIHDGWGQVAPHLRYLLEEA
jgi:YjbE family integral membrane protein